MAGEMVERVARALDPQAWNVREDDVAPEIYKERLKRRSRSLKQARDALQAMSEPTANMRLPARP